MHKSSLTQPCPSIADCNSVPELQELLGEPVVFINWPKGTKGTNRKWKHLTVADMTPEYLLRLPRGNIGVALGEVSGGLCAVDCDTDDFVESFIRSNPHLANTLQTHGARGRVFWVRLKGNYPRHTTKLKTQMGEDVGEFRSSGSQSIIWGIHPDTRKPYQKVVKQRVVEAEFNSIVWPREIANTPTVGTEEPEEQKAQKDRSHDFNSSGHLFFSTICTVEDALRECMPTKKGENNDLLFKLARAILTLGRKGQEFSQPELDSIFDQWYARAIHFLREGQTKEAYYLEFFNALRRAKYPLGSSKIAEAWGKANTESLPIECMRFENPELRRLIAFLKQMQAIQRTEPFFVTSRTCAALLGHKSHMTAATWLGALVKLKYIRIAEPGNQKRATRYFYVFGKAKTEMELTDRR